VPQLTLGPEKQMLQWRPRWTLLRILGLPSLPAPLQRTACATEIALNRRHPLYQYLMGLAPSSGREWQPSAPFTECFGQCRSQSTRRLSERA